MNLALVIVLILPIILIGRYVYSKDKNREPTGLLLKFFLLGFLSAFLVIIFSLGVEYLIPLKNTDDMNYIELFIYVFIFIAFVEEVIKWFFIYRLGYNNQEFDEMYDIIVYAVFVALGFAFLENLVFVCFERHIEISIYRGLLAVPGHTCFAIFMGYYLSIAKFYHKIGKNKLEIINKIKSIIIPTLLHGIYDYCCFSGSYLFLVIFFIFIINLYLYANKKLKYVSNINNRI